MERKRTWIGEVPKNCSLCAAEIKRVFVDGVVKETGAWAIMCATCHSVFGAGLGHGQGQKYQMNKKTHLYVKVSG